MIAERRSDTVRIVQTYPGLSATWSQGNKLAFVGSGRPGNSGLIIRSLDTGLERNYPYAVNGNAPPRWLSDGSALIVHVIPSGDGGRPGGSFYRLDVETSEFTWLFAKDSEHDVRSFIGVLSRDDKTFYLAARPRTGQARWNRIVGLDLATGAERLVVALEGDGLTTPPAIAIAPDGSTLAIRTESGRTMTVRVDGTQFRELRGPRHGFVNPYGTAAAGSPAVIGWTPDGTSIVFAVNASPASTAWRIMRMPATGGQSEIDGLDSSRLDSAVPIRRDIGRLFHFDLSADGSRVAFSSRTDPVYDVWRVLNVTSALGIAR